METCSSVSTTIGSPLRCGTLTGTISSAKTPDAMAASARCWLRSANASWSSREKPYFADPGDGIFHFYFPEQGLVVPVLRGVDRMGFAEIESTIRDLAVRIGAVAWHVFMLVPTGRGKIDDEVSPQEYEQILNEICGMTKNSPIPIRVTCGPHFMRVVAQNRRQDQAQPNLVRPGGNGRRAPWPGHRLS